ncbi:hypothetical protein JD78_01309 [Modestobacter roseus]|uniref:Uncharacterized protein n=1 Tax=Modestobacter roseus TaxID=1181884 RepID=A0A562IP44_9ACTN|nr:hypothetical protein [Modestobacter roseus]TWH72787.1 hypothetical protein JD78_01309 [Modestobacter roseus]
MLVGALGQPPADRRAEQDHGEEHRAHLGGQVDEAEHLRAALDEGQHERAQGDPERVRPAQQRRGQTGEHQVGGQGAVEAVRHAQHVRQPDQPGDGTGTEHRTDHPAVDPDAGGLRRLRGEGGHPQGVAPDAAVLHEVEEHPDGDGDEHETGDGGAVAQPQVEHVGHQPAGVDDRRAGVLPAAGAEDVGQEDGHQRRGDGVHQDRGDHLADAPVDAQQRRDQRPQRADQAAEQQGDRQPQGQGQRQVRRQHRPGQRGHPVLAVDADVEQAHPQGEGGRDAGQVQRDGVVQRRHQRRRLGAVVPHHRVGRGRRIAAGGQEEGGDQQRQQHRDDRAGGGEPRPPGGRCRAVHAARPRPGACRAPVMCSPSSVASTVRGSSSATTRPR